MPKEVGNPGSALAQVVTLSYRLPIPTQRRGNPEIGIKQDFLSLDNFIFADMMHYRG